MRRKPLAKPVINAFKRSQFFAVALMEYVRVEDARRQGVDLPRKVYSFVERDSLVFQYFISIFKNFSPRLEL